MSAIGELAGFFAAHAFWCVSDAETLIPIFAYELWDGSRSMERMEDELFEDGVLYGKERLAKNPDSASRAVLIYDGYVTLADGKTDALIVDAVEYGSPNAGFTMLWPIDTRTIGKGLPFFGPSSLAFRDLNPRGTRSARRSFAASRGMKKARPCGTHILTKRGDAAPGNRHVPLIIAGCGRASRALPDGSG